VQRDQKIESRQTRFSHTPCLLRGSIRAFPRGDKPRSSKHPCACSMPDASLRGPCLVSAARGRQFEVSTILLAACTANRKLGQMFHELADPRKLAICAESCIGSRRRSHYRSFETRTWYRRAPNRANAADQEASFRTRPGCSVRYPRASVAGTLPCSSPARSAVHPHDTALADGSG
jgi:hypothetical protein